jgi:LPXTG-site transpeptidase (sortase) family protein
MVFNALKVLSGYLLLVVFALFSLLLFSHFGRGTNELPPPIPSPGLPVRLMIPAIGVIAGIQEVGVTAKGEMEVPSNIVDVAWFKLGLRPGEKGSAVISGHFDGKNGEEGVFFNLHKLKKGDKLFTEDDKGIITPFIVRGSRAYNPGYAEEIFSSNDKAHLNLITCDGVWNGAKDSYSKRLVVFADSLR